MWHFGDMNTYLKIFEQYAYFSPSRVNENISANFSYLLQ